MLCELPCILGSRLEGFFSEAFLSRKIFAELNFGGCAGKDLEIMIDTVRNSGPQSREKTMLPSNTDFA